MNPIDSTNGIRPSVRVDGDRSSGGVKTGASGAQSSSQRGSNVLADDAVELTDTASKLSQLTQDVARVDGVDVERVEAIRQQISEGSYEVNADRIAEALVQLERDLV